ncbi:alanine racemase [Enterobacteriaceae endosymbiont of Donacia bicoloricornis]|uniref:alanine racemase n=1 Tax=Enterobacteriaceae endosymbiont of Donacia bicoloricornis TaxID=2675772 RepID=UPI0014496B8B|nr:alanine racemase [Enterobacteriaceae endosymbiont of Donacia bicoloricornis]QJC37564.1 alanine racemase [Enterobacteriaceae endosymbiont of Donacia bicoloricornis]
MVRPICAIINSNALKNNLKIIKKIAYKSKVWAVLKADAYGHGIKNIYSVIKYDSDGFAILTLDEAIILRKNGCIKPILLLEGFFNREELYLIYKYFLTITIHNKWQLNNLIKFKSKYPINIYIKINTGMNRLGFPIKDVIPIINIIKKKINVYNITLMTHFADASKNSSFVKKQINNIKNIINIYHNFSYSFANSAAILWHSYSYYDWIRTGIILYGASPTGVWEDIAKKKIQPVMTLKSKIISIQKIYPGDIIGYNCQYYTNTKNRIGIIACGYADGYPRNINHNKTYVLIKGIKTLILGSISMDMIVVDLNNIPTAKIGSSVELWGENIKIDDIAKSSNTIGYELMCSVSKRVPRILK